MKVGMIGLGKLGLPVAVAIAAKGHEVMGFDVDHLRMSKETFKEFEAGPKGEPNGFREMLKTSTIKFGSMQEVVDHSEIIFLSPQTPHPPEYEGIKPMPKEPKDFDYSYLIDCVEKINICNITEPKVVAIISTVLPQTIRTHVLPKITNPHIKMVYNPFFIAMGTVIKDYYNPEFVLLGLYDQMAHEKIIKFYDTIYGVGKVPYATLTIEEAEAVKVLYNFFISIKINFANFMMELCHKIPNTNVDHITNTLALAKDRIISKKYLFGGMSDSGGCHLRDQSAMKDLIQRLNITSDLADISLRIREDQTKWFISLITEQLKKAALPVVILGKAFKENLNLTHGSCAILLKNQLQEVGIHAEIIDPLVDKEDEESFNNLKQAIYFIGTKHDIFKNVQFPSGSIILDPFRYLTHLINNFNICYIPIGIGN